MADLFKKGDAKNIEKLLSKYDNVSHKYIPIGFVRTRFWVFFNAFYSSIEIIT